MLNYGGEVKYNFLTKGNFRVLPRELSWHGDVDEDRLRLRCRRQNTLLTLPPPPPPPPIRQLEGNLVCQPRSLRFEVHCTLPGDPYGLEGNQKLGLDTLKYF